MPEDQGRSGERGGLLRRFAALGLGEVIARVIAFGTMLLVARRLGPGAYGSVGVAAGILLYLNQLADGGIELVGIPAVTRDPARVGILASSVLTFRVITALALTLAVLPFTLLMPEPDGRILAIYALSLVWTALSTRWTYLGLERPGVVASARVLGETAGLVMVYVSVQGAGDVLGVPTAAWCAGAIGSLVMLAGLGRMGVRIRPSFAWAECASLFRQARHLLAFTLLGLVLYNFDLLFLRATHGPEDAGLYAAAYAAISFGANVIVAYAHSVLPVLSRPAPDPASRNAAYHRAMKLGFLVTVPAAVGGLVVAPSVVPLVFGSAFGDAVVALQWLVFTLPLAAVREIAVVALIGSGGERPLVRVNALTAAANVVLNVALVPKLGMLGAAAATLLTEVVRLGLAAHAAHRAAFAWPSWRGFVRPIVCGLGMLAVIRISGARDLVLVSLVAVASYGGLLVATGGVRREPGGPYRLVD